MLRTNTIYIVISLTIIFLLIHVTKILSQQLASIHGRITSQTDDKPVAGVNVIIVGTSLGAASDSAGYYIIQHISVDSSHTIQFTHIGYESVKIENMEFTAGTSKEINISLKPTVVNLAPVKIEAERLWENYVAEVSLVGVQRMKPQQIVTLPGAFDDSTSGRYISYVAARVREITLRLLQDGG